MLPIDPSPSKVKQVKTQRVLDWVTRSSADSKVVGKVRSRQPLSIKRKMRQDENTTPNVPCPKRVKLVNPSKPVCPRKFYLPNEEEEQNGNKVFPLPSTPESKQSTLSETTCFSPDKLDGIFVRGGNVAPSNVITSDSESAASTPVKQHIYKLACGLDSPETDGTFKTPEGSGKKFSKLGHRWNGKTPLQLFREGIKKDTRKMNHGSSRAGKAKPVTPAVTTEHVNSAEKATDGPAADRLRSNVETESHYGSDISTIVPNISPTISSGSESINEIDRSNNTLADDGGGRLVQKKLLPLFQRQRQAAKEDKDQLIIDAGQKDFDEARQCSTCRMIYTKGEPNDEALHKQFHSRLVQALKFTGWKKEHVAHSGANHRIIYIDDSDPPHCRKKIQALKVILDQELGYVQEVDMLKPNRRIYLYVSEDKQIKGVCIAESISRANRLDGDRASVECVQASIGINRLWVYAKYRREGVATKLLDAIRCTFGMGMCVCREDIAFSDPTSHGKMFAAKFTGTRHFLVYKP